MVKTAASVRTSSNQIYEITGISRVEEYLKAVDQIYQKVCPLNKPDSCELWFRGVKSTTFHLESSIARGLGAQAEIVYLSKFRSLAYPYLDGQLSYFPFSEDRSSYWGWLFLMQHYGVSTRLLDWSREALVALLFALGEPTRYLYKIVIKKEARERMNTQLLHYGLTEHDLFPSIQNVAADITQELMAEGLIPGKSQ